MKLPNIIYTIKRIDMHILINSEQTTIGPELHSTKKISQQNGTSLVPTRYRYHMKNIYI